MQVHCLPSVSTTPKSHTAPCRHLHRLERWSHHTSRRSRARRTCGLRIPQHPSSNISRGCSTTIAPSLLHLMFPNCFPTCFPKQLPLPKGWISPGSGQLLSKKRRSASTSSIQRILAQCQRFFFCVFFSDVPLRVYVKPKPVLKVPCCLSMCFGIGMMMKDENPTNGCMTGSNLVPLGSAHIFGPYQGRWKWLGQGLCHVQLIGSETRHFDPFCTIPSRHVVWCDARFLPLRCEFTSIISIFSYT